MLRRIPSLLCPFLLPQTLHDESPHLPTEAATSPRARRRPVTKPLRQQPEWVQHSAPSDEETRPPLGTNKEDKQRQKKKKEI